ncbi:MAG TPA: (d)CMP kinase [Bryobacteraceae bacterium]|nr:(d)CMP kinase [Bryobacteraceae bacterium]HUO32271.1 (d)CMP kinase [Bryobacteraceae bacterium]
MSKRITVAIDGPAGAGKSTLARRIAAKLGYVYIDSGAMYRAVALWALRAKVALSDMHRLEQLATAANIEFVPGDGSVLLNGEDVSEAIRRPEISQAASEVSLVPAVRRALVEKQRELGQKASVVMEGRDIGSVVFPDATVKIFLDAQPEERAARRSKETSLPTDVVGQQLQERDQRDRTRAQSPLVQAPDAVYVDTTGRTIEEVETALLKIIRDRTSNGQERTH